MSRHLQSHQDYLPCSASVKKIEETQAVPTKAEKFQGTKLF